MTYKTDNLSEIPSSVPTSMWDILFDDRSLKNKNSNWAAQHFEEHRCQKYMPIKLGVKIRIGSKSIKIYEMDYVGYTNLEPTSLRTR